MYHCVIGQALTIYQPTERIDKLTSPIQQISTFPLLAIKIHFTSKTTKMTRKKTGVEKYFTNLNLTFQNPIIDRFSKSNQTVKFTYTKQIQFLKNSEIRRKNKQKLIA